MWDRVKKGRKMIKSRFFSNLKSESVFQVILTGILTVLFILLMYLTFGRIDVPPIPVEMGDGRIEMYDSFSRAKDLLTLILPLFTTVLSFWLVFSLQERKVNEATLIAVDRRAMAERDDT